MVVGYSFGSLIALKISNILEKLEKSGKVLMIDGSPKFLKQISLGFLPQNFTEVDLQQIVLKHSISLCFPKDDGKIFRSILNQKSWENQLECFKKLLENEKIYSADFGVKMLNALVNRIEIAAKLDLKEFCVLQKTQIKLIRASESSLLNIEEDFWLGKHSKHPVKVEIIHGNHATILENPKLFKNL